jgi:hypothetical protein
VFFFMVFVFSPSNSNISIDRELMCSIQFHLFLMAYSREKLKSNDNETSSCFKPFWTGNVCNRLLPMQTLLWVSFKHILISLTSFIGIPNSVIILYNTCLLAESYASLKSINNRCSVPLYSHFSSLSDECRIADQWLICFVKIYTDDTQ